jgi:integrase
MSDDEFNRLSGAGIKRNRPGGIWQIRAKINGVSRALGSTETTDRIEAERIAAEKIAEAKRGGVEEKRLGKEPMRFHVACDVWLAEKGPQLKERDLDAEIKWIKAHGTNKFCHEIEAGFLSSLRNDRIATVKRGPGGVMVPVKPATVNKTLRNVQRVLNYVADTKSVELRRVKWGKIFLKVPKSKPRPITEEQEQAIYDALRWEFIPLSLFACNSGLRAQENLFRWDQIRWNECVVTGVTGKGHEEGRDVALGDTEMAILKAEYARPDRHPVYVFSYVAIKTRKIGRTDRHIIKGQRYPMTYTHWKGRWDAARKLAGLPKLRIHDLRHTAACRTLRATGNLKLVQEMLGHSTIDITARFYAEADHEMVRAGKNAVGKRYVAPNGAPKTVKAS